MTFWQILSCITLGLIFGIGATGILVFKKALKKENEINEKRYQREQEWHDQESENWRYIDPALQKRIKELEATCKRNQNTIAGLEMELLSKDEFMRTFKLKDLYEKQGGFIFYEQKS